MIYLIIAVLSLAVISFFAIKSNFKKRNEISGLKNEVNGLLETVEKRNKTIQEMERINNDTSKKKKDIRKGSDSDNFDSSLDVLSKLSTSD